MALSKMETFPARRSFARFSGSCGAWLQRRPEMLVFALLLGAVNAPLLAGSGWHALIFEPAAVCEGQWWRLFTHALVHVTWYHLLLDGAAFFILYHSLIEQRLARRLAYVFASGAGSLGISWFSTGLAGGLCGLSGIAHGLMAVSAVELISGQRPRSSEWRIGVGSLCLVVGKAAYEALSGCMLFSFLDFGLLGTPVAVSHAGGIVGALAIMLLFRRLNPPIPFLSPRGSSPSSQAASF